MAARPRYSWLVIATALGLAACQDGTTAPRATPRATRAPRLTIGTTPIASFTVDPTVDNVFVSVEGHRLSVPAGGICDPATSGYGPSLWNQSCTPATAPVKFTVYSSTTPDGSSRIDVDPDVRFVPSTVATIVLRDSVAASDSASAILYCAPSGTCVNEGTADPDLQTFHDPSHGIVYRRVKHFSGYVVIFGVSASGSMSLSRTPLTPPSELLRMSLLPSGGR